MMTISHIQASLDSVVRYLLEHPEDCCSTDTAASAVVEEGLRSRVVGPNGAVVISDMPKAVGGSGAAPTPGWFLRAALAACDATMIAMRAAQNDVRLDMLEVTVDSESDDRGLLGMDDAVPAGPLSIRVRIRIGANGVSHERLQEIVTWAEKHSPVGDAIRRAVPSRTEVTIE